MRNMYGHSVFQIVSYYNTLEAYGKLHLNNGHSVDRVQCVGWLETAVIYNSCEIVHNVRSIEALLWAHS